MITIDQRKIQAAKWLDRAKRADDVFDRFYCVWIALIIHAQRLNPTDDTDGKKLRAMMVAKPRRVEAAARSCSHDLDWLRRRRGTVTGHPVLDPRTGDQAKDFKRFARYLGSDPTIDRQRFAAAAAAVITKIRNNLFHGRKSYDDREDIELLSHVNPFLVALAERFG